MVALLRYAVDADPGQAIRGRMGSPSFGRNMGGFDMPRIECVADRMLPPGASPPLG